MARIKKSAKTKGFASGTVTGTGTDNHFAVWNGTTALYASDWRFSGGASNSAIIYVGTNPAEIFGGTSDSDDFRIWSNDGVLGTKACRILMIGEASITFTACTDIIHTLGDRAGIRKVKITDDISAVQWSCDSDGNVEHTGYLHLTGSNKELRFYEGVNYVGFVAPALTANTIYVLPTTDGTANQVLKTDGSKNLGWVNQPAVVVIPPKNCLIHTGTYRGDGGMGGGVPQAITGIGFPPKSVKIWVGDPNSVQGVEIFETTDTIIDDDMANTMCIKHISTGGHQTLTGAIISLDINGFTVSEQGINAHPNRAGIEYNYMCLG